MAVREQAAVPPAGRRATAAPHGFRPDVQGLRAIAVTLVVLYHLYPGVVRGGYVGVDVFFVISGFLITGHLVRGLDRGHGVRMLDFYGRRARRLLPAAALVLTVTWALSRWLLPVTRIPAVEDQIRASALYFQNWRLADQAVSYLNRDTGASPVEHFWSLSVEEQFYLVWPLLFLAAAGAGWLVLRRRRPERAASRTRLTTLRLLAVAVVAASLAYSIVETRAHPQAAYFVTTTRMWELGAGGLIALAPRAVTARLARVGPLAWVGFGLVVASALVLSGGSAFPGWVALAPVLGAALLIVCGSADARGGTARVTASRPFVFVGDISYSLYLWHWPLIVLWLAYDGGTVGLRDGAGLAAASVLLAWATKAFVEDPVRRARRVVRSPAVSLATAAAVAVPALCVSLFALGPPAPFDGHLTASTPGAVALARHRPAPKAPFVPPVADITADNPLLLGNGCLVGQDESNPDPCRFGDTTDPRLKVALVGDSHAAQWSSALDAIGKREHWEFVGEVHSGCRWTPAMTLLHGQPYTTCHDWGQAVLQDLLTTVRPDVVIVSDRPVFGTVSHPSAGPASRTEMGQGLAQYLGVLNQHGIRTVAIEATPEPGVNVPDCLASRTGSISSCGAPADQALWTGTVVDAAADVLGAQLPVVDMNDLLCTDTTCPPVIGNVVVYRDDQHLAKTYSLTMAPYLRHRLLATGMFRQPVTAG